MAKTSTTIDQLPLATYLDYAAQQDLLQEITEQFPVSQVPIVSEQVRIYTTAPQPTWLEELLGVAHLTPWATFEDPATLYKDKKQSPRVTFGVARILPSLGNSQQFTELQQKVQGYPCASPEEEREKNSLSSCLNMIQKMNQWASDIYNRIHQFMHG